MANHLDLEEQEQLDQLKHFWKQYGNLITWALIAVLAAFAGWNGYQYWQRSQASQAALAWVVDKSKDEAYRSVARLRLASLHAEARAFADAMAVLQAPFPAEFAPLVADRRGDLLAMQSKPQEARAEYERAYQALGERSEYRRIVEIKLNALGVDPRAAAAPSGTQAAASEAGK